MHFHYHKALLFLLLLAELWMAFNADVELRYNLHLIMGTVYFGVSFWFIFGERQWWPYLFAGAAYVAYIIVYRILLVFEVPFERDLYHLGLALLWGGVLAIHLFVERAFGPPMARPPKDRNKRYFPDDD